MINRFTYTNEQTFFQKLKSKTDVRLISIGRLDMNSEGLLLLTNDGNLARKFELPRNAMPRIYRVRVHGIVKKLSLVPLPSHINSWMRTMWILFKPSQID